MHLNTSAESAPNQPDITGFMVFIRSIRVISVRRRQKISDAIAPTETERVLALRSCLLTSYVFKEGKDVQSVLQQRSDHRISKPSVASLDIALTLTLYKLARLLSRCIILSFDRIYCQTQLRYMVCKKRIFQAHF